MSIQMVLGVEDTIKYAKKFVNDEPFLVFAGDTIYKSNTEKTVARQLLDAFNKTNSTTICLKEVPIEKTKYYGIVSGEKIDDGLYLIKDMVEKPDVKEAPSNLAITAAYALKPEIFNYIEKIKPGKGGEYQLTDALALMSKNEKVFGVKINGKMYDIGSKESWIEAFIEFAKNDDRFADIFKN